MEREDEPSRINDHIPYALTGRMPLRSLSQWAPHSLFRQFQRPSSLLTIVWVLTNGHQGEKPEEQGDYFSLCNHLQPQESFLAILLSLERALIRVKRVNPIGSEHLIRVGDWLEKKGRFKRSTRFRVRREDDWRSESEKGMLACHQDVHLYNQTLAGFEISWRAIGRVDPFLVERINVKGKCIFPFYVFSA